VSNQTIEEPSKSLESLRVLKKKKSDWKPHNIIVPDSGYSTMQNILINYSTPTISECTVIYQNILQ
jgi:hypothetical protein